MGKIIKKGVKAIASKELRSIFAEKVLKKYSEINRLIDEHVSEIVDECSQYKNEDRAYDKLEKSLKRARKDVTKSINDIL